MVVVPIGSSIQAALDSMESGVVELAAGIHRIDQPLAMRAGVVLRGQAGASIETTRAMQNMVSFGGGFAGPEGTTVTTAARFQRTLEVSGDPLLASAAVDRLFDDAHVIVIEGDSFRNPPPAKRKDKEMTRASQGAA